MAPFTYSVIENVDQGVSCSPLRGAQLGKDEFDSVFNSLKDAVLARKPVLKEILFTHGGKKLYDYAKDYIDANLNPTIEKRQTQLISVMEAEVGRLLGSTVAKSVAKQLADYYFVSTADHHGPLTHPFFINSNLLMAAPYAEYAKKSLQNVIVLACGAVSQNNSSFPRGIVYHSYSDKVAHFHAEAFFPAQYRLCPVTKFRSYDEKDLKRVYDGLKRQVKENCLDETTAEKVTEIIQSIYGKKEVLELKTYSDQVTVTNADLWKRMMRSGGEENPPNLVYLEVETIVSSLLRKFHLFEDTSVHDFLFDPVCARWIDQYYQGITGTFSIKEDWGTYMFWALPKGERYRLQLRREGNELVTKDGKYRYPLTPESIDKGIADGELVPSSMLVYTVLCFYYGLKCLGGFSQVNYLTFMKNAYIKMQLERGKYRSIEICARAQTKELVGDVNVAFLQTPGGELVPATGIDLILYGKENWWKRFVEESRKITLNEAMNPMMPELYTIIYGEGERDPKLLNFSPEDITRHTGLREKVQPCAFLS